MAIFPDLPTFHGPPKLVKGALVGIDPINPLASIIVFQYNPETMTRRLEARAAPASLFEFGTGAGAPPFLEASAASR